MLLNKIFKFSFICVLLSSIVACNNEEKVFKGVIFQHVETPGLTMMQQAFHKQLEDKGYTKDKIKIDNKNLYGNMTMLASTAREIANSDYDFIVTLATPATQAVVRSRTSKPLIYMGLVDPDAAGVFARPKVDTTGTIVPVPVEDIFELIEKLTPEVKNFGIIYSSLEENAVTTVDKTIKYLDEKNIKHEELIAKNTEEMEKVGQELVSRVDAFFIPNDSLIQRDMSVLSKIALEANIPIYCTINASAYKGCLATISTDIPAIGRNTADLIIEFVEGAKIIDIPAREVPEQNIQIRKNLADTLNITIPQDLKNIVFIEN